MQSARAWLLQGMGLLEVYSESDYTVLVGNEPCTDVRVTDNLITCSPSRGRPAGGTTVKVCTPRPRSGPAQPRPTSSRAPAPGRGHHRQGGYTRGAPVQKGADWCTGKGGCRVCITQFIAGCTLTVDASRSLVLRSATNKFSMRRCVLCWWWGGGANFWRVRQRWAHDPFPTVGGVHFLKVRAHCPEPLASGKSWMHARWSRTLVNLSREWYRSQHRRTDAPSVLWPMCTEACCAHIYKEMPGARLQRERRWYNG